MKKPIFFILFLLVLSDCPAQDKGLIFMVGPSVNLYYGDPGENFTYSSDLISWQFNGQLGLISRKGEANRGNMLGVFGSFGSTNPGALQSMQSQSTSMHSTLVVSNKFNQFYTVEGGIVIAGFLRLSGGIGAQSYTYSVSSVSENGFPVSKKVRGQLDYYSGTMGLIFNLDAVNWVIDANIMTGMDIDRSELRLSTGFVLKF